ncbi:MAG: redoxin domain-containing protein [Planctomycetota bacterium]
MREGQPAGLGRGTALLVLTLGLAGCASEPAPAPAPEGQQAAGGDHGEPCCEAPAAAAEGDSCREAPAAAAAPAAQGEGGQATAPQAGPAYVTRAATPLDPAACKVGQVIADAAFVDLSGRTGHLRALCAAAPATVVVFTALDCPVTKNYAPLLEERTRAWRARGATVLAVDPSALDEAGALRAWAEQQGWSFPVTRDPEFALTEALGARRTADAFLLDREGRLRYRGPLDDQFGINYRLEAPRRAYLGDALEAVLAGKEPEQRALEAPGCRITKIKLD